MAKSVNLGLKLHQANRLAKKLKTLKGEAEKAYLRAQKLEASAAATELRLAAILGISGKARRKRRRMSKAGRLKMAAAARKVWAARRAKKQAA